MDNIMKISKINKTAIQITLMINKIKTFNPKMKMISKIAVFINSLLINKKINNLITNKQIQVQKYLMRTNNNHSKNNKFNSPKVMINRIKNF